MILARHFRAGNDSAIFTIVEVRVGFRWKIHAIRVKDTLRLHRAGVIRGMIK
jgi:hypothetical protein